MQSSSSKFLLKISFQQTREEEKKNHQTPTYNNFFVFLLLLFHLHHFLLLIRYIRSPLRQRGFYFMFNIILCVYVYIRLCIFIWRKKSIRTKTATMNIFCYSRCRASTSETYNVFFLKNWENSDKNYCLK